MSKKRHKLRTVFDKFMQHQTSVKITGPSNRTVAARQVVPGQGLEGESLTTSSKTNLMSSACQRPQNQMNSLVTTQSNLLGGLSELQSTTTATVVNSRPTASGIRNPAQTIRRAFVRLNSKQSTPS